MIAERNNRVLVITRELPPIGGGAGYVAINLVNKLSKQGAKVDVITMHYDDLKEHEEISDVNIYRLKVGRKNKDSSYLVEMLFFVIKAIKKARELDKENHYNIAHAHALVPDGLVLFCLPGSSNVLKVVTTHGSDVPGYNPDNFQLAHKVIKPLWKYLVRKYDLIVSPSVYQASLILKIIRDRKIEIVPNGIELGIFDQKNADEGIASEQPRFLIVSRLVERKNYEMFFDVLSKIKLPVRVDVVGEGPLLGRLKEAAHRLTVHDIHFHGWLANGSEDWKSLYKKAKYFVFPSLKENFPINLLEAQLSKTLVLASDIPSNKEVLNSSAVFFDPENKASLESQLRQLLEMKNIDYDQIVNKAYMRVTEEFSWDVIASKYVSLYRNYMEKQQ